ncbi:sensor histidine kinase [Streptomyces xanthophaeus]|uniref:sensor histidine kinase n=1 Tax=Streptomyces xanthophaeus TaxID=67385 RepID=UPI00264928FC|nr:histidine kinase [Streptomyces xanthophaeus]WKD36946.1 two-component sensor histidine kinase [Streptomyces xanthophaeus]
MTGRTAPHGAGHTACTGRTLDPRVVDAGLAAAAMADAWVFSGTGTWAAAAPGAAAAVALLVRRRWPVTVFVFTLLAVQLGHNVVAALAALLSLAEQHRTRRALAGFVLAYGIFANLPDLGPYEADHPAEFAVAVGYSLTAGGVAVLLGRLVLTRRELAQHMVELRAAQEQQRELHAQQVLARERAHLAREMHDVVSHQVSLIAVRAGALQVSADSTDTKEAARTIRTLSAATLDELRHMVAVLRAPGSGDAGPDPQLQSQSALTQLDGLIADCGLDVTLTGEVPRDASPAVERAAYRTVQEALTNVRKHAPGSAVVVEFGRPGPALDVTVTNSTARHPALALPSARHGLVGLRERAEQLGGTLAGGPTPDGGYRLHLQIPRRATSTPPAADAPRYGPQ